MTFTIEVERRRRDEDFDFGDLKLHHQECYGGKVVQKKSDTDQWYCECTRCGNGVRISNEETILFVKTAIDGQKIEFDGGSRGKVVVVQRDLFRLAPASPNRGRQVIERPKEEKEMRSISKWVTLERAKWRRAWHSTRERRLVTVDSGTPVEVIPIGDYRVPLIREYDSLAFVNMGPRQVAINLKGNAGTSDGVTVEGRVSIQVIIRDEESCIKRIAADPDEEERLLSDSILTAVQETITSHTWHLMISVSEEFAQTAEQKLSELLQRTNSCFEVKSLAIQEIRPQNEALAESLEKAARAKEEEKLQKDLTHLRAERAVLERKAKEEELESELQMQSLRHQSELENEREKLKLQQERDDAQISTQKKVTELLETEAGRIAAFPRETFELLLRKVELEITDSKERQKLYRELLRFCLSPLSGEVRALKAFLTQQYGVRFSEEPLTPALGEGERETQEIDKGSREDSSPDLSDNEAGSE